MPMQRRLPKRGFRSPSRSKVQCRDHALSALNALDQAEIDVLSRSRPGTCHPGSERSSRVANSPEGREAHGHQSVATARCQAAIGNGWRQASLVGSEDGY